MDHDIGIRQGVTFAFGAAAEQNCAHAGRLADAIGVHIAGEELHRIVNGQSSGDAAAGRVDVKMNILFRISHLQKEQLSDYCIGDVIVDGSPEKYDAIHQ